MAETDRNTMVIRSWLVLILLVFGSQPCACRSEAIARILGCDLKSFRLLLFRAADGDRWLLFGQSIFLARREKVLEH